MDTSSAPTFTVEALMAHASWARALARRLVADPDAAEELVQETLLAGWKHPPAQDGPVRPWLATVLRNLARSRRRGETRARRRHQAWHDDVAPAASPEEALAGLQAQQRLAGMLARLSEPYRHTVYLRYVEGGTAADIARAQGVPEGTVRWRIKTALDQLRRWYSEEEGPDWRRALLPLSGGAGGVGVRPSRAVRAAKLATGVAVVAALLVVAPVLRRAVPVGGVSAVPEDPAVSRSVRLLPAASGVIQGRVLGPAGAPAAGAAVVLAGPAGAGPQVAGADGAFRFGDLAAGRYSITASAGSLLPGRAQVQLAEGGSASAELQLSAGGAQLRGQVLDAAAGVIPSARVEVESDHEDAPRPVLLANEQGRFAVQLPLGGYWVSVRADGYARETTRVELAGDQAHDFFLQPAAVLAGQVVDGEGGDPVPDAFVRADPVDGGHGRDTRSGRDGSFRLGDLQPGRYRVFARKGTWVGFAAGPVVVAVAGAVDGISIPLSSSFSLTGRVLDPAGNPQAGARVGLQEARGAGYGFFEKEVKATTDAQGRYRIEGLVPGVYQLSAHARPFGDAEDVTAGLVDGDQSVPDLRLGPAARVEGQVLAADGKPAAGLEVQLEVRTADDGNALYRGRGSRHTDAQGRFGVDDLGAGWLTATATGPRGDSVSRKVALLAGQSTRVELRFAAPGFVQGRVRWTDGAPAAGVHVVWSEDDSRAATDADGRYRLGPLAPGESSVQAERPGTTSQRSGTGERDPSERWVEVRPGQTVESVDLVLSRGDQTIAGVVLDPEGSPVGGATLEAEPTGTTPARSWVRTRVVTGADGRFTILALTRGQHRVRATDPRFPPAEVEAAAAAGKCACASPPPRAWRARCRIPPDIRWRWRTCGWSRPRRSGVPPGPSARPRAVSASSVTAAGTSPSDRWRQGPTICW